MKAKKKGAPKLNILKKKISVDPPKGFHWMEEAGRYYLMAGDYKPQKVIRWLRAQHNKPPLR